MTNKDTIQKKYDQSRGNLLLIIIFTLINIALLFTSSNTMFLFSITIPYYSAVFAYILELTGFYIVSGVVLLLYLACWFFSKKHYGWFIPALILFILDIVYLGYVTVDMGEGSNIIDILVHIWVLYYLASGIYFGYKLKHLPEESEAVTLPDADNAVPENTAPTHTSDTTE